MQKKSILGLIGIAVALLTLLPAFSVSQFDGTVSATVLSPVWHNSTIFIRGNGTIEPKDAPLEVRGNTFSFKNDIYGGISVERNNTILDGNGHRLFGNYYRTGVVLERVTNVTVQGIEIQYFANGVFLDNATDSKVANNKFMSCGLRVDGNSTNNQIVDNTIGGRIAVDFSNNTQILRNLATYISVSWSNNITIGNNRISDQKLVTLDLKGANYTEGIYIDNSANCNIYDNTIQNKNLGIDLWQSINLTLAGNKLTNNQVGFKLWGDSLQNNLHSIDTTNTVNGKPVYFLVNQNSLEVPANAGWIAAINSTNITVQNQAPPPNWDGVLLVNTANAKIANMELSGNFNAIRLDNTSSIEVTNNRLTNNHYAALYFEETVNANVTQNSVKGNYKYFNIWHASSNNLFYGNNFIGNTTGSVESTCLNQWDSGSAGNYWSTFTGVDLNQDGISDVANIVEVNSGQADRNPLMKPTNGQTPDPISNSDGLTLAMPQEYLNYTIIERDGVLWAQIDGTYPMHATNMPSGSIPMVYPMPPGATNIHISLDGSELSWTNYTGSDATSLHYTDLGMWEMISCDLDPARDDFLLQIHYEHPIQVINGSATFLYDLNIATYLFPASIKSIANFNVEYPAELPKLNVFLTGYTGNWAPKTYNLTQNENTLTASFSVVSWYGQPLLGDIAFVFSDNVIPEFPPWTIALLLVVIMLAAAFLRKRNGRISRQSAGQPTASVKYIMP